MKYFSSVLIVILVLSLVPRVQAGEIIDKGMKIGVNISNASGYVDFPEPRTTFLFGSFMGYGFNDLLAVQGELYYIGKGYNTDGYIDDVHIKYKNRFEYLEFAALLRIFPYDHRFKPCLCAGPYVSWLMMVESFGADVSDNYKDFDYGLIFGIGAEYPIPNGDAVSLDIRYSMGLMNINDQNPPFDEDTNNNVISFILGYSVK